MLPLIKPHTRQPQGALRVSGVMLPLIKPHTRQPQGALRVSTRSTLTNGISTVATPLVAWVDGVSTPLQAYDSNTTYGASPQGITLNTAAVSGITGAIRADGLTFSMPFASGCSALILCMGTSGGSGNARFLGPGGGDGFGYNSSGAPTVNMSSAARVTSSVTMTANVPTVLVYGWRSGAGSAYTGFVGVNGVLTTAGSGGFGADTTVTRIGHGDSAGFGHGAHRIAMIATWKRLLTLEEAMSLSLNPWQIFEPRSLWIPAPQAAAGGLAANPIFGGGVAASPLWGYVA